MKLSPSSRRTFIEINGSNVCLNEYFIANDINKIPYNVFRQRIIKFKERGIVTEKILSDAIRMDMEEWISFYGGGKHKEFTYNGNFFTQYKGVSFHSLSAFLRIINKYENYSLIKSRLLRGWDIDKAILEETIDTASGLIYVIRCKVDKLVYVGQTIKTTEERFKEHIYAYENKYDNNMSSRLLFQAFNKFGIDKFYIDTLEDNIPNEKLTERENYWINKLQSLGTEFGLNMKPATNSCVGYGKAICYMGEDFSSLQQAVRHWKKLRSDCPEHILEKRIRDNRPLPKCPRKHSKHPEAGSSYWRKWKGLIKNGNICPEWSTIDDSIGYENFKKDMGFPPSDKHKLGRLDISKPHSKENSKWMTAQEEREIFSGTEITAFGKCYKTCSALAKEFNIGLSTLLYRLNNGLSPEEAVNQYKKTSAQKHTFDGIIFDSKTQMLKYIAKRFNITFGQAKDRYDRHLPFDHQPFTGNKCTILGNEFDSEKEAVAFYRVSSSSYNKKKAKGLTPEKAILALLKLKETVKDNQLKLFNCK